MSATVSVSQAGAFRVVTVYVHELSPADWSGFHIIPPTSICQVTDYDKSFLLRYDKESGIEKPVARKTAAPNVLFIILNAGTIHSPNSERSKWFSLVGKLCQRIVCAAKHLKQNHGADEIQSDTPHPVPDPAVEAYSPQNRKP